MDGNQIFPMQIKLIEPVGKMVQKISYLNFDWPNLEYVFLLLVGVEEC